MGRDECGGQAVARGKENSWVSCDVINFSRGQLQIEI